MQPEKRLAGTRRQERVFALVAGVLGTLAFIAPIWPQEADVEQRVGGLLVFASLLEILHGFRRADEKERRAAWFGGTITMLMAVLLLNAPLIAGGALALFVAIWFAVDAVRYAIRALRAPREGRRAGADWLAAAGNGAVVLLILLLREGRAEWTVAAAGAVRMLGVAWNILFARTGQAAGAADDVVRDLGLSGTPGLAELGRKIAAEEAARVPMDRRWVVAMLVILFAVHLGRMGLDRSSLGLLSPVVALIGDCVVALAVTYGVLVPLSVLLRKLTAPLERGAWAWASGVAGPGEGRFSLRRFVRAWLEMRLRFAVRVRRAGYSFRAALGQGLKTGLPFAAVMAATMPVWGMSWYFDTENWAAGIWDSWAASRTDAWREAMTAAVPPTPSGAPYTVAPPGIAGGADFSFLIVGDPGEGDPSQHILRDQILFAAARPDVRFVVISSDVIYPAGAMKDYERKFWLPMKGVTKPVYAIPGNHDWYDALEGFVATFYDPASARAAMRARIEKDLGISGTNDAEIERLIAEAGRLRELYRVPTGFQQAPFFQIETDAFAFIAVDTGVRRTVDSVQLAWLKQALASSREKFRMVLLGHPFYAIGTYQGNMNPEFAALHRMLREEKVPVVMAGDTHDLEYYRETDSTQAGGGFVQHHFVNGGGGAYLSLGTALATPGSMPSREWAFYPATGPLVAKIDAATPAWKLPAWWWTRSFDGWPFSPEWLSAAFDYNVAPFFQSFIEVRVEHSTGRLRLIPYGVHGPLRWSELQTSANLIPAGSGPDDPAEWTFPLATSR